MAKQGGVQVALVGLEKVAYRLEFADKTMAVKSLLGTRSHGSLSATNLAATV